MLSSDHPIAADTSVVRRFPLVDAPMPLLFESPRNTIMGTESGMNRVGVAACEGSDCEPICHPRTSLNATTSIETAILDERRSTRLRGAGTSTSLMEGIGDGHGLQS